MIKITEKLLTNSNRPKKKLQKLEGIVLHWTANTGKGADADANRNYFNSTNRACSAHYIVDMDSIIRCIPDNEVAYHVGANAYKPKGMKFVHGVYSPNHYLIGIEMCVNSDGNFSKTLDNTVDLVCSLLKKYSMTTKDLYRHFDITGKDCPRMYVNDAEWQKLKDRINHQMTPVGGGGMVTDK